MDNAKSNLKKVIKNEMLDIMRENDVEYNEEILNSTILLDTGLDSLGFAILVARLEEKLEYDPFVLMTEPIYPKTFFEFFCIYEKYYPTQAK